MNLIFDVSLLILKLISKKLVSKWDKHNKAFGNIDIVYNCFKNPYTFLLIIELPICYQITKLSILNNCQNINYNCELSFVFRIVDFIHFMAYDYVSSTSAVTGLSAPFSVIVSNRKIFI